MGLHVAQLRDLPGGISANVHAAYYIGAVMEDFAAGDAWIFQMTDLSPTSQDWIIGVRSTLSYTLVHSGDQPPVSLAIYLGPGHDLPTTFFLWRVLPLLPGLNVLSGLYLPAINCRFRLLQSDAAANQAIDGVLKLEGLTA